MSLESKNRRLSIAWGILVTALGAGIFASLFFKVPHSGVADVPTGSRLVPRGSESASPSVTPSPWIGNTSGNAASPQERSSELTHTEAIDERGGVEPTRSVPKFLSGLGSIGQKVWKELIEMPFQDVKRTAAVLELGRSARRGAVADSSGLQSAPGEEVTATSSGTRFVSWGCQNPCAPGTAPAAGSNPGSEAPAPPALTGFVARVYDTYQSLLNTHSVRVRPNDPFGCGCYKVPLKDLLPEGVDADSFRGWLALSKISGKQGLESDRVMLNLDRPQDVTAGEGELP